MVLSAFVEVLAYFGVSLLDSFQMSSMVLVHPMFDKSFEISQVVPSVSSVMSPCVMLPEFSVMQFMESLVHSMSMPSMEMSPVISSVTSMSSVSPMMSMTMVPLMMSMTMVSPMMSMTMVSPMMSMTMVPPPLAFRLRKSHILLFIVGSASP